MMSKMSEMEATTRELRDIASSINDIANWLTSTFNSTKVATPTVEPGKALTFEGGIAILAEKSRYGGALGSKSGVVSDFSTDADEDFLS